MKRFLRQILPAALCLSALGGCMKWDYGRTEDFSATERGLFIVNEGMFQYGNATLSYYDPETKTVENEVFHRANAFKLGDVAQSMTLHNGVGWIAVNNSHVVFAVDPDTFREVGRITNLTSPRYIHFVSDEKAYVTQIWDNRIFIVNPKRYEITGYIECPDMTAESGSTEQMVQYGKYVFVNCWSYQNRILKIDTETDRVVGQLTVGIQPASLAMDRNNKLWTVTDGGYEGSPYVSETEARKKGLNIKVNTLPVAAIPRARTLGETDGLFKVVVDADTNKILGCSLFGPETSEIINIVSIVMKTGQEYTFLRDYIFTHPSMSEALNDLMNF